MQPTLSASDILHVKPYGSHPIRQGDVVVFRLPGSLVSLVHRVISNDKSGIRTVGDNNDLLDPNLLCPRDIIGRVVYAERGHDLRYIPGGPRGVMVGAGLKLRRGARARLTPLLRPIYDWLARSGLLRKITGFEISPKVVLFSRPDRTQYELFWKGRRIGHFGRENASWIIGKPFRLFVDAASLGNPPINCAHSREPSLKLPQR